MTLCTWTSSLKTGFGKSSGLSQTAGRRSGANVVLLFRMIVELELEPGCGNKFFPHSASSRRRSEFRASKDAGTVDSWKNPVRSIRWNPNIAEFFSIHKERPLIRHRLPDEHFCGPNDAGNVVQAPQESPKKVSPAPGADGNHKAAASRMAAHRNRNSFPAVEFTSELFRPRKLALT